MIHLEGMGLQGSLLARKLHQHNVPFTWHDVSAQTSAWPACTGAVYPSGSTKFGPDSTCYMAWRGWEFDSWLPRHVLEQANYVFSAKRPPHEGRYSFTRTADDLGLAGVSSYHLNAQELVESTRRLFSLCRVYSPPQRISQYIVTHGWGARLSHVYWGWTRLVELNYDRAVYGAGERRPAFYFRPNKYVMCYAYPVPGTQWWYAGSSIIKQRTPARLEYTNKYARWEESFLALGRGAVTIDRRGEFMEGWRPAAAPEDNEWLVERDGKLLLRPLWNSGVRHFPYQWALLARRLELRDESVGWLL